MKKLTYIELEDRVKELEIENNILKKSKDSATELFRLLSILDEIPAFIYLQDKDYSIRYSNKYFNKHFRKPRKGERCFEIFWNRKEPCEKCITFKVFDTKVPQVWDCKSAIAGKVYQIHDYPFEDINGSPLVLELGIDISERKLAEEQVKKEKNFSESLIHSLPGIMYLFDEFGRPLRWNKNLEEVTGFSSEEIKNMTPLDFITPEDEQAVQKAIGKVFHQGSYDIEAGLLTKNGQVIPYFFTGVRFINNDLKYLVGVGLDITEKNKAEKEKENLIKKLQETLSQVKQLTGLLPICTSCKKIRDDEGYWTKIETYIKDHSEAEFTHSICPSCLNKLYPEYSNKD